MDLTKQYIDMCEKAVEIQELEPEEFEIRNIYCEIYNQIICPKCTSGISGKFCSVCGTPMISEKEYSISQFKGKDDMIWLPRQDQLQEIEMFHIKINSLEFIYQAVDNRDKDPDYWYNFNSGEQFFLAYIMQRKYNKTWNGEDWIEK